MVDLGALSSGSSWEDRVRDGAYISPTGTRIEYQYEDIGRVVGLRTAVFGFPGVDGDYVQQNGFGSRRYPLRCYFSGRLHDIEATAFEATLIESGLGKLEHPLYGTITVVPVGEIVRRDDLKTAANQSIVEVEFWTTLTTLYPQALTDPENEILAALSRYNEAAAQQFSDLTTLTKTVQKAAAKGTIRGLLSEISDVLSVPAKLVASINHEFQDLRSTINYGLDVLVGQPLLLAQQIKDLITAPARALDGIISRINAYADLADRIFGSDAHSPSSSLSAVPEAASGKYGLTDRTQRVVNDFHIADMMAGQCIGGTIISALQSTTNATAATTAVATGTTATGVVSTTGAAGRTFLTKPKAIAAAEAVVGSFDAFVAWRDPGFETLQAIDKTGVYQADPGEAVAQLQHATALAAGHIVAVSFSLVPERAVVLDRPRTIVDLCGELYEQVDEADGFDPLCYLIETNDLNGDEIQELPRGRKITYYKVAA